MLRSRFMKFGGAVAALVMVLSLAAAGQAEARMGGSFGSRGMRTFQSPAITQMAPSVAPVQRSMTPNGGFASPSPGYTNGVGGYSNFGRGGFLSGFGGGLLGGMLGGLFFHGLFGSMMGYGFGGLGGGFSSIFQLLLIGGLIWFAFRFFRGQTAGPRGPGSGFPFGGSGYGTSSGYGAAPSGYGGGRPGSGNRDELGVSNSDLAVFERLLGEVQDAFAREDHQGLRRLTTPEMVSYFSEELADNAKRGVRNEVTDLKFGDGEVAESWREGAREYATVAMRWSAIDILRDRTSGAVVEGDAEHAVETTELWTFVRDTGGTWQLAAIQDARAK